MYELFQCFMKYRVLQQHRAGGANRLGVEFLGRIPIGIGLGFPALALHNRGQRRRWLGDFCGKPLSLHGIIFFLHNGFGRRLFAHLGRLCLGGWGFGLPAVFQFKPTALFHS